MTTNSGPYPGEGNLEVLRNFFNTQEEDVATDLGVEADDMPTIEPSQNRDVGQLMIFASGLEMAAVAFTADHYPAVMTDGRGVLATIVGGSMLALGCALNHEDQPTAQA